MDSISENMKLNLAELAMTDPIAAYGKLRRSRELTITMSCAVQFDAATVGVPILGALDTQIDTRTWIDNLAVSVQQPNSYAGNVQATMYLEYLKRNTGVNARIQVQSGPRYVESLNYTPLENLTSVWAARWPKGWKIERLQTIGIDMMLTQVPASTPYLVVVSFNAWQFADPELDQISTVDALKNLAKSGICVPTIIC